jgi:hypothetical protein
MSDENDLPDIIPIYINGNLYWMPKAYLKDLGERIEKLEKEVKRLGNLSSAQFQTNINLTRKLLELEKNQKILQQLIPLDWQQKENTKEIAELGNKIKGLEGFAHSHIDDKQRRRMIEDIAELKEKQEYDDDELRVEVARHIEIIGNHEANIAELKEHLEITDEFIPDMQLTLDNQERQHGEIAELKSALFKHLQYEGDPLWEELGGEKESLIEREEVACEQDTLPLRDDSKPTEPKYYPVTSLCNDYDECSLCPEDPKFCDLNEHVEKEEEESQDDYEAKIYADFVKHYEGYWINKHNKLIEEFLEKLKFVYNRICITGTYGSLRDLMKEYEERLK